MIQEIVKLGHPALRAKGKPIPEITEEIREIAQDMIDSMRDANGVGLAAQQLGLPLQLAVVDVSEVEDRPSEMRIDGRPVDLIEWMPLVIINPELELGESREIGVEGCLSIPEVSADVNRAASVLARAQLIDGRRLEFEAFGLLARALQHEVDHLNGILFIDRLDSATKASLAGRLKRLQRQWR